MENPFLTRDERLYERLRRVETTVGALSGVMLAMFKRTSCREGGLEQAVERLQEAYDEFRTLRELESMPSYNLDRPTLPSNFSDF